MGGLREHICPLPAWEMLEKGWGKCVYMHPELGGRGGSNWCATYSLWLT